MNIDKFTQKSKEALTELDKVAMDFGHQEIEEEHLLYALLRTRSGSGLRYPEDSRTSARISTRRCSRRRTRRRRWATSILPSST